MIQKYTLSSLTVLATVSRARGDRPSVARQYCADSLCELQNQPVWEPMNHPLSIDVDQIETIIWSTGFRFNYSWVDLPVFNEMGEPVHDRGVSRVDGIYFIGLPWLYTWGSGCFSGVARDAEYLAEKIIGKVLAII